jgi:hypothetical protein
MNRLILTYLLILVCLFFIVNECYAHCPPVIRIWDWNKKTCVDQSVQIYAVLIPGYSGEIEQWDWEFTGALEGTFVGDNDSSTATVWSGSPGTYEARAWGQCCICGEWGSDCAIVKVVEVASVTSNYQGKCINCDITFIATTDPSGYGDLISWSGGGNPSTGSGSTFTTNWNTAGTKTVTATCGTGSKSKQVTIAAPTNFRETYRESRPDGVLYFEYRWDSTSGNLAHLAGCKVGEKVDYPGGNPYNWPSPPWNVSTTNPYIPPEVDASAGLGTDTHGTGGPFIKPYQAASFTATQVYRYSDCGGSYTTLMGPHSIDRVVYTNPYCTSGWTYRITKTGAMAYVCLPP